MHPSCKAKSLRSIQRLWILLLAVCISTFAQETRPPEQVVRSFSLGEMLTFFFLMLGPLKILGPFVQMTRNGDANFARRLALRAFVYSCLALVLAAVIGENSLRKYHISVAVLAIAAGVILFLVALRTVMQQFDSGNDTVHREYEPDLRNALSPLAFPTIVTPYGVAAVIISMALTPEYLVRGEIYAALLCLMLLNLVAMLFAKPILKYLGMPMLLMGTVLGVIQVALGLTIIFTGLRVLGFGGRS
jgi:multiple antibiotic resistance protein